MMIEDDVIKGCVGKDVNDELKIRVGLMRERKERERT